MPFAVTTNACGLPQGYVTRFVRSRSRGGCRACLPFSAAPSEPAKPKANVLVVVGTRPEAIKLLPIILALQDSESFKPVIVTTGQHDLHGARGVQDGRRLGGRDAVGR